MEKRYTVRQAADATGVKSYVLRYWEDELGLCIHRNELGHRYYTGYDIQLFLNIKELKKKGLQLRGIRDLLPQMELSDPAAFTEKTAALPEEKRECPPGEEEDEIEKTKAETEKPSEKHMEKYPEKSAEEKKKNNPKKGAEEERNHNPGKGAEEKKKNNPEKSVEEERDHNPKKGAEEKKILEFQAILERLIAQELQNKNEEEERCRSLDLAIRRQQLARREAAVANEKKTRKRQRI